MGRTAVPVRFDLTNWMPYADVGDVHTAGGDLTIWGPHEKNVVNVYWFKNTVFKKSLKSENVWGTNEGSDSGFPLELNFGVAGRLELQTCDGKWHDFGTVVIGQRWYTAWFQTRYDWFIGSPNLKPSNEAWNDDGGRITATDGTCVTFRHNGLTADVGDIFIDS